ncbi:hypothetical protein Tdes44962_MAKER02884 [Teratosphaeria destructans]|uniref:Uncharacterized protein n=1 Tax=Teratosphaeria destructans TaxID=418781 RepID=A0A9W7W232_9PEZI|nr:hypothetical protein Tdes44962_MAKER02884 [Teratosphaeria destructans]
MAIIGTLFKEPHPVEFRPRTGVTHAPPPFIHYARRLGGTFALYSLGLGAVFGCHFALKYLIDANNGVVGYRMKSPLKARD